MLRIVETQTVDGVCGILQRDAATSVCRLVGRPAHRQRRVPAEEIDLPPRRVGDGQEHGRRDDHCSVVASQRGNSAPSAHL